MGPYIIRRLLWMIVLLLFVISDHVRDLLRPAVGRPGRAARRARSRRPELLEAIREQLGLDKPLYVQFFQYMKGLVLHFDFGNSFINDQDVRRRRSSTACRRRSSSSPAP